MSATRPLAYGSFATDTNYAAGASPWSGLATKVAPSAGVIASGLTPQTGADAEWINYLQNLSGGWQQYLDAFVTGTDFVFRDDFLRATLDTDIWTLSGANNPTIVTDNAAGGYGAIDCTATGANSILTSIAIPVGTRDFCFGTRQRSLVGAASSASLLVKSATAAKEMGWIITGANWAARTNGVSNDTGIAHSSSYASFICARISSVIYFSIDGTLVWSEANTVDSTDSTIELRATHISSNSQFRTDVVSLAIGR